MLHIHVLYERTLSGEPIGCSYIRVLRPLKHPSVSGKLSLSWGHALPVKRKLDIVIIERLWRPDVTVPLVVKLVGEIRRRGARLIYFIDDNLLDLHIEEPWKTMPSDEQRMVIRYLCRFSDGIVVATDELKERLECFNKNIVVLPNALDETLFVDAMQKKSKSATFNCKVMRVGYMGTYTHYEDLMLVMAPLREFLRESQGRVMMELVGISGDRRVLECFQELPVHALVVGESSVYESFVPWAKLNMRWDFAIAPLAENLFNECKSDIKYLDYGALGIPAILSDVKNYRNTVNHGVTGWLCRNDHKSWLESLRLFRDDSSFRSAIGRSANQYVMENRVLKYRADDWLVALERLSESRS